MSLKDRFNHRLERSRAPSLKNWDRRPRADLSVAPSGVAVDCGWGRLLFGQTFTDPESLARALQEEHPGKRDVALYLNDPHVVLSYAPQDLFLDPSHTFRLWFERYQSCARRPKGFHIRLLNSLADAEAIQRLYIAHHMVPPGAAFVWNQRTSKVLSYWVAEDSQDGRLLGVVNGVDHAAAFQDPENGASLWALAVDPQAPYPGIGEALVRQVVEYHQARGRAFLDLSVMHDNSNAIRLYRKLGFERIPAFALKNKNAFNEPLFIGRQPEADLNPYATIIVDEARRRGIGVEVIDAEAGYFALMLGGRRILCRESLSELTSAIAMSRCDDKAITQRVLKRAGLRVPEQIRYQALDQAEAFLSRFGRVVVKPARGEQGAGISVDVRDPETLETAIAAARKVCEVVILEEFVEGEDLRIVVIDFRVVAAAIRRPAQVVGTGRHSIRDLIQARSRRRRAATGGESSIPLDAETERCVRQAGYGMKDVLPEGEALQVRKTANLHTGGTIHDVTADLDPALAEAACAAARALDIPVTGLDFLVPDVRGSDYVIIEANERPGLANHEPQPTAERFVDLLFPRTAMREGLV
ncbi:N-acetylglutaminylglutamine synthetase [Allochromatium vinosum]|uniref:GNAT-family acetyltransferase TIGR03103 n=1 Tax=Allochromatium vinosum (strain ATCC 17899 / DSM 180 / NBRC 103801 / NCIMB 10441 / D) TaxID=572477 RepID=D3RTP2_ALLVD|nr:N-acetylglutaminylglutamine synthetase [Allochromatium vinosum]ADC62551.1 GNAT-family acetyltransferase TIGR03103 [Allochromatium vinosum DSM 180]